ncbi:MAG: GNAT family N-acetyltransferase [Ignavibacteriae bacterium]|nr:GNAT family N-acetyltransferase [Ignavibacteriota bacterium]
MGFTFSTLHIDNELELRLLDESDAEPLFRLVDENRKHLREWLPWLDHNTRVEDTMQFLHSCRVQYDNQICFNASIRHNGAIAGVIGFHPIDWQNRSAMIGYWIAKQYEGKGMMTRACSALTTYAFKNLSLNRVDIRCATGNARSCAIPKRLGFRFEGTLRQAEWLYDHFVDLHVYSMLAKDWSGT